MRRDAKKDDNQNEITRVLEQIGFSIMDTSQLGNDRVDFVCAFRGVTAVVEVKSKKGILSTGQKTFRVAWRGLHIVARSYHDVLKAFKVNLF